MEKTAAAHGLQLQTTDYVAANGLISQLADGTSLLKEAFATAKGAAPGTASTGDGYAVFQVADVKPAHAPDFAAYKETILNDYRDQKAPELLNQQLNKLADRAKVLGSLAKAAAEFNLPLKTSDLVDKTSQVPDLGAMTGPGDAAFALPKGGISGPINTGENGVVLQVTDKQEPSADDVNKNFAATRDQLLSAQKQEMFNVYAETLVDKYTKAGAVVLSQKSTPSVPGAPSSPLGGM
jgi:peptidyl-prolyl cis-trans isomerase D